MPHSADPKTSASSYRSPNSADALIADNVAAVVKLEEAQKSGRTLSDRIAAGIAAFCGSMTFVWVHVIWFVIWLGWNCSPWTHFDPFPFTFLTLVVSLEAIFLSTFILISQNIDTKISERRNHLDLQINLLAEQENTKMLVLLERMAQKMGVMIDDDPSLQVLEEATRPDRLAHQIEVAESKRFQDQ